MGQSGHRTRQFGDEKDRKKGKLSRKKGKEGNKFAQQKYGPLDMDHVFRMLDENISRYSNFRANPNFKPPYSIHAKLEVSNPEDAHEQQADEVAHSFVHGDLGMGEDILSQPVSDVSRKGEGDAMTTSPEFDQQLQGSKGQGQTLDEGTKTELEQHTGKDLSGVNVHISSAADALSKSINAKAFAHGQDIYFKQGEYNPQSEEGKELLAHEVAHTVQQGSGVQMKIDRQIDDDPEDETTESEQVQDYTVSNSLGKGINIYDSPDFSTPHLIENETTIRIHWKGVEITKSKEPPFELDLGEDERLERTGTRDLIFEKVLIEIIEPIEGSDYTSGQTVEGYIYNFDRWNNLQILISPVEIFDFPSSRYRRVKALVKEHDESSWGGFFADFPDTKTKYLMRFFTEEDQRLFKADSTLYDRVKELLSKSDWAYATELWGKTTEDVLPPEVSQKDLERTEELQTLGPAYKAYKEYDNLGIFSSSSAKKHAKENLISELNKLNNDRYKGDNAIENFETDIDGIKTERLAFFRTCAIQEAKFLMNVSEKVLIGETPTYIEGYVQPIKDDLKKEKTKFDELEQINKKYAGGASDVLMRASYTLERNEKLQEIRDELGKKYPILLDENIDLEDLYNDYAVNDGSNLELEEKLEDTIIDRHKDIDATRKNLEADPDLVWEFESLITYTKEQINLGDEMLDSMVDEKVKSVQHRKMLVQAGLGAIGIGLAIVSFGELSPVAAAMITDAGIGLAAIDAYMIYTDTRVKKAASNIAHDKTMVLTQDDPSYGWLAIPIISMGFDMLSAFRMLKALKGVESLGENEANTLIKNAVKDSKLPENTTSEDVVTKLKQTLAQRREVAENIQLLAEAQKKTKTERALELAKDPKKPKPDYYEGEVGAEAEAAYGYFKRDPTGDADFKSISGDYEGKTFDAIGSPASVTSTPKFKMSDFLNSLSEHINKQVDYLLVDVRYMSDTQRQQIMDYLVVNYSNQMDRIIFIGLK